MPAVPFTMEAGLSQVSGVVREERESIVIEYQSKLLGLFNAGIRVTQIPFQEISEVVFAGNIFQPKLRICLKTLRSIGEFPAQKQGDLELKIARANREEARRLASSVNLSVSRYELLEDQDDEWV